MSANLITYTEADGSLTAQAFECTRMYSQYDWLVRRPRIQNPGNLIRMVGLVPTLADSRHPVTARKPDLMLAD